MLLESYRVLIAFSSIPAPGSPNKALRTRRSARALSKGVVVRQRQELWLRRGRRKESGTGRAAATALLPVKRRQLVTLFLQLDSKAHSAAVTQVSAYTE